MHTVWARGDRESLLGQGQAVYQVGVAGIGTDGVERGIADAEDQFTVLVGVGLVEIFEGLVTIAGDAKRSASD